MSLWENEESVRERLIQRILIVVGAVAALGVVIWIMHNALSLVSRPRNGIGFAASARERRLMDGDGADTADASANRTASATLSPGTPNRSYSAPRSLPPPRAYTPPILPPPPATNLAPILTPSERVTAHMALVPLQQALTSIKDFDSHSFWNGGDVVMRRNLHGAANSDQLAQETAPAGSALAVDDATDALGAMVALYGHPDRFPEPVRNDVGVAATAMRSYLKLTMAAAITNDPADRQRLRPLAEKRLNESTTALQHIEAAANGGVGHYVPGVAR